MTRDEPLLMTPGPTRLPKRVLDAGARPMIHHRSPAFSRTLTAVVRGLRPLFGTSTADVLPIHTTGRGAMEAAITNLFTQGDEVVACCNGKFGEMWADFAESYGLVVHRVCRNWERGVDASEVEQTLNEHPRVRAVMLSHCDTSTGVLNDVAAVLAVTRKHDVLGMVDCISALGGVPFQFDAWGADVVVTASQKCLMASPGLAFVAISPRAWAAYETARLPRNYWDFGAVRSNLAKAQPETPGTAPVHIFLQVEASLALIEEEGLDAVYTRHARLSHLAREQAACLGLSEQCPHLGAYSPTLTAFLAPPSVAPKRIREALLERGILLAGGLGPYASTSIRVGHMGDILVADVEHTFSELAVVLDELGALMPERTTVSRRG